MTAMLLFRSNRMHCLLYRLPIECWRSIVANTAQLNASRMSGEPPTLNLRPQFSCANALWITCGSERLQASRCSVGTSVQKNTTIHSLQRVKSSSVRSLHATTLTVYTVVFIHDIITIVLSARCMKSLKSILIIIMHDCCGACHAWWPKPPGRGNY